MKNQKGNAVLVLAVIVVLVLLSFWWLMKNGYRFPQQTAGIQNTKDLDVAKSDLDSTNLNEMDPGISQITADASSF